MSVTSVEHGGKTYVPEWDDGTVVIRTARKGYHCNGGRDGGRRIACPEPIPPNTQYVNYHGESAPYESGQRYHIGCAIQQGLLKRAE